MQLKTLLRYKNFSPTLTLARDNLTLSEVPVQRPQSTPGVVTLDLNILAFSRPGELQGGDHVREQAGIDHLVALDIVSHIRADG